MRNILGRGDSWAKACTSWVLRAGEGAEGGWWRAAAVGNQGDHGGKNAQGPGLMSGKTLKLAYVVIRFAF